MTYLNPVRPGLGCLWSGLVLGLLLLVLTTAVVAGQIDQFDQRLLAWFAAQRTPLGDQFFAGITWLGSFYLLGPGLLVYTLVLALRGRRRSAWVLAGGFYGAALLGLWLKRLLDRVRPDAVDPVLYALPPDAAFPSGHTTHAVAAALCLWWLVREHRRRWQWPAAVSLASLAGLVAGSRLYLQVHWPSDVLGGALLAVAWCLGVFAITRWMDVGSKPG